MLLDAIVLAGGRSSRLGGQPKSALVVGGRTLLDRTVDAADAARRVVVVGDATALDLESRLSPRILLGQEEPMFGGPAAGTGAGLVLLAALDPTPSDYLLVLACDMPRVDETIAALLAALSSSGGDGVIAVDADGHPQYLAAAYATAALTAAVNAVDDLAGTSMHALVSALALDPVTVPAGATEDVDTPADLERLGIASALSPDQS